MAKKKNDAPVHVVTDEEIDDFGGMVANMTKGLDSVTTITPDQANEWCSSGSVAANLALSGHPLHGFPFGRIINFEGESDTGKSLLAQTAMREAQKTYQGQFRGLYIDSERGISMERLENMGMFVKWKPKGKIPKGEEDKFDTTNDPRAGTFQVVQTTDLSTLGDHVIPRFYAAARKRPDMRFVMCIDSMSLLVTDHERNTTFETRDMARAVEIRKLMRLMNDTFPPNLMVFLIYHQSQRISTSGMLEAKTGNHDKDISGGKAVKYVPDVRIEVDYGGKEYRGSGDKRTIIGQIAKVKVIKTRLNRPMLEAACVINHEYGFTQTGGLWKQLDHFGLINKEGKMWQCPEITGEKKYYENNLKDILEEPENTEKIVGLIMARIQMASFTNADDDSEQEAVTASDGAGDDPLGLGDL